MNTNRELKLGVVLSYANIFVSFFVAILYTPFLLQYLGQQQYGLYSMGQAAVSYLSLTEFGLGNAVVRYAVKCRAEGDKNKEASLYGVFQYIYLLMAAFILIAGTLISQNIDKLYYVSAGAEGIRQLRIITFVMTINLSTSFIAAPFSSIITAYERFTFSKTVNLLYTILKPMAMIPLLLWGYKAVALSLVTFITTTIMQLANIIYAKKQLKISINLDRQELDFSILKEIASYSFFIFLGTIVSQLNDNADIIVLGAVSGEMVVAVYSIGQQLNSYVMLLPQTVSGVFFPRITMKMSLGASMQEMTRLMIRVARIALYLAILIISGFVLFGQDFLMLWTGEDYNDAYWIVLVLSIPSIAPLIQSIGVQIIQAMNKHQFRAILYAVCALLNVIVSIPVGMKYGAIGCAAITGVTTMITSGIIMNWYYYRKIGIDIPLFWKEILLVTLRILPVITIGIVLKQLIDRETWLMMLFTLATYTLSYCVYLFIFVMRDDEKQLLPFISKWRNGEEK